MGFKPSGNNNIDALLHGTYWTDTGKAVVLTYSIDTTGNDGLNFSQVAMVQEALKQWSNVANITFQQVASGGNLRIGGENGTGGVTYYKEDVKWWNPTTWGTNKLNHTDIKLGKDSDTGIGNRFLEVALHEIGHALGLKHPGNYNGEKGKGQGLFLPYSQDNSTNTIMSYNDVGRYAGTPMSYDIRAIQYLYGARIFNSSNTTYKFDTVYNYSDGSRYQGNSNQQMKLSVWDSGGTDTFDFSKLAFNPNGYHLDIREGNISTLKSAFNSESYQPRDNTKNTSGLIYYATPYGTSVAYGAQIENVIGTSSNDNIFGNSATNVLNGGAGNDYLDGGFGYDYLYGGDGNDSLYGGDGNDSLYGDAGEDYLSGGFGNDSLSGGDGNNSLYGDAGDDYLSGGFVGNDYLDGGTGNDSMSGGAGNDTYVVDSTGDVITEYFDGGIDRVYSSISYSLAYNIENLNLTGSAYFGYGNSLNNTIIGNDYNNYLSGGDGNDTLYGYGGNDTLSGDFGNDYLDGGTGNDSMYGGTGNDTYVVDSYGDFVTENLNQGTDTVYSSIGYTLENNLENLTLTGSAYYGYGNNLNNSISGNGYDNLLIGGDGNDTLYGNGGNDTLLGSNGNDSLIGGDGNDFLIGEVGNDSMFGGTGNDTYGVDSTSDAITENFNEGIDTVSSSINYSLGNNLENLTLIGSAYSGYGNSLNNNISGNGENNYLSGGDGNDFLYGDDGNDTLFGGNGNDTLKGGKGNDLMSGGTGDDTYIVDSTGDVTTENLNEGTDIVYSSVNYTLGNNVENLTLTDAAVSGNGNSINNTIRGNLFNNSLSGGDGNDVLYGDNGNDTLIGGNGNDTLDGGKGNDSMFGGTGDDTYIVDSTGDVVTENLNEGTDTVSSSINYSLGNNLENLTLIGSAYSGYGNSLNNNISGNGENNYLSGGDGNDTLSGGNGNDTLSGGTGNDTLSGGNGNDTLSGGTGNDSMYGGTGDDTYIVDSTGDVVTENLNEGTDTVSASINYTLGNNLENLTLIGTAYSGSGNSLNNTISGNNYNNYLNGGAGHDTLYGYGGNDTLDGSTGDDRMYGGTGDDIYIVDSTRDTIIENLNEGIDTVSTSVNYTLGNNLENLTLTGTAYSGYGNTLNNTISGNIYNNYLWGADGNDSLYGYGGNDTLSGGNGNDYLDGGTGNDWMYGGTGDDSYSVDSASDVVTEYLNEGTDTVYSSVSYSLGNNIEHLTLTGTAYSGYGNSLNNSISGNSYNNYLSGGDGNDTLIGNAGNDTLVGGFGNDILTGGADADKFVFNSRYEGIDTITDFISQQGDKLLVSASGFGGGLNLGALFSSQFIIGSGASDTSDRFIYNSSTGGLFFDADGIGASSQVQFAKLSTGLNLISSDIVVV